MSHNEQDAEIDKSPRTVLFYGMSGAGKGTQARLLVDQLQTKRGTHFVEVGQLLRNYAANEGTYGAYMVRKTIDEGNLVPPSISAYLWSGKLLKSVTANDNVVFDGAARSIDEAKLFDKTLKWLGRDYTIFILEIDAAIAKERAIARGESREDDNDEAMQKRLAWFKEDTMPAIEYMKEQGADVYHIDGGKSIEEVQVEILSKLHL